MTQLQQYPAKAALSDAVVQSLPPILDGRVCIRDSALSQLTLQVGPRSRVWYLHATLRSKTHRVRLGPWPIVPADQARDQCLEALRRLYKGEPVKQAAPTPTPTLAAVLSEYLAARKLSHQANADLRSIIAKHAADWSGKPVDSLDASSVMKRYRSLAEDSPAQATRLLGALSALTRYASAAHGKGDADLIKRVRALLGATEKVAARDVTIPDDQQATWFAAVQAEAPRVARYLKALMLTGARANELRQMQRDGWDAEAGTISIATSKNGKPHAWPAGPLLCSLMAEEAADTATGKPLFNVSNRAYREACERIGAALGLDWHLHDLRRTFATAATRAGLPSETVRRLMNHSADGVTARHYVRLSLEDLRPAMVQVEARIAGLWGVAEATATASATTATVTTKQVAA